MSKGLPQLNLDKVISNELLVLATEAKPKGMIYAISLSTDVS